MAVLTPVAAALSMASSIATCLTMLHLRWRWDVHASSVRWLFWCFFLCVTVRCSMRAVFFVWMLSQPSAQFVDEADPLNSWTYGQLNRLGIHGIQFLPQAKSAWITLVIGAGDVALGGIALTLFPLAYELCRLARIAMDRGAAKEQRQIQRYRAVICGGLCVYAAIIGLLAVLYEGYNVYTHRCLLGVYGLQFAGLLYMILQLVLLKRNGRKFETVHGVFVASPVYQRLKQIMLVYAFFAFQFQVSTIVVYFLGVSPESKTTFALGISLMLHNSFGLALAITTSCSQTCVFRACARCIPEDLEAQFQQHRLAQPRDEDLEAPRSNPVFVYTDIQSSTALWNTNGVAMSAATDIHDHILRSTLLKHRGYEITTVGDAFQVAFRTIRDAVEYCMDVQLQLLVAKWPKEIHGLVPATSKVSDGRRVLFRGLRVRMGIHDGSEEDGKLIKDIHAVTGKTMYTGMSEVIAEFVGDLGTGGQILLTDRVATWLKHHHRELSIDAFVEYVGEYPVPYVDLDIEIYQLQPAMLAMRTVQFPPLPRQLVSCDPQAQPSETESPYAFPRTRSGRPVTTSGRWQGALLTPTSEELTPTVESLEDDAPAAAQVPFHPVNSPQSAVQTEQPVQHAVGG